MVVVVARVRVPVVVGAKKREVGASRPNTDTLFDAGGDR